MKFDLPLDKDFCVKIGAHEWQVKLVSKEQLKIVTEELLQEVNEDIVLGLCVFGSETIYVNMDSNYPMRLSTFMHELLHAFEYIYGLKLKHQELNLIGDLFSQVLINSLCEVREHG